MVLYARDIIEKDFLTLSSDSSILEGAKQMKKSRHGFAIIGTQASPQGIVTEWDIVSKVVAEGRDPAKVTMGEVMSGDLLSIEGNLGLSEVSQMMSERGVRRLLVREGGQVIGFITAKTMLSRMNDYVDKVSSQISRMQTPSM